MRDFEFPAAAYDNWKTTDPRDAEPDERLILDRQEEEERIERWDEFIAWVKQARLPVVLRTVADLIEERRDPYHIPVLIQERILNFQETEGWIGVLSAIARALKDNGQ